VTQSAFFQNFVFILGMTLSVVLVECDWHRDESHLYGGGLA